ncbi:MAG: 30S ribosomal protein S1, partial [Schleiferiaceae bacterium]|nr:30S ribosomal protein S1 [Schleiferiaceae bacterium]
MSEENQVPAEEVQQETPAQEAPQTEETVVETPVAETTEEVAEEVVPEAPAAAVTEEVAEEVVPEAPAFSWADVEGGAEADSGERQALVDLYAETLGSSVEHQVVEGKVTVKTDREVIIDINSKSEGVVSLNEFRYNPELAVGDTVEVLVDRQE